MATAPVSMFGSNTSQSDMEIGIYDCPGCRALLTNYQLVEKAEICQECGLEFCQSCWQNTGSFDENSPDDHWTCDNCFEVHKFIEQEENKRIDPPEACLE